MDLKRKILFLTFALAVSCVQTPEVLPSQDGGGTVILTAPQGTTKTTLGTPSAGVVPVYWTSGDRINVNGTVSSPLFVEDGQKLTRAEFKLNNVSLPYSVVYPAEIYSGKDENGMLLVDVPSRQEYVPGSFGNGADLLFGTSVDEGTVIMEHLCGTIKVSFTDAEASKVSRVVLTSLSEDSPIAGRYAIDPDFAVLSPRSSLTNSVELILPEGGVALGTETVDFHFTIPAGTYPAGFEIRFEDSLKRILRLDWLRSQAGAEPGITVTAGHLVGFAVREFEPDAREICSSEDWELFAAAYNAGGEAWKTEWLGKDGSIKIGADISARSLTQIVALSHPIDGCGHSITQTEANKPLIGTSRAVVSNLTMKGRMTPADPNEMGAAVFASTLGGAGKFVNCHNETDIVVNATEKPDVVAGGFVRSMRGGVLQDCTNRGDITVYTNLKNKDQKVLVGGFVAIVRDLTAMAVIDGCTNYGEVKVTCEKVAGNGSNRPINASYAGIVANVVSGDSEKHLKIVDCANEADISVSLTPDPSGAQALVSGAGGIIGMSVVLSATGGGYGSVTGDSYYLEIDGCVNNGSITNSLVSSGGSNELNKAFSGGIAGVIHGKKASHAKITGCSNYGSVCCYEGSAYKRAALSTVCGGLLGCGAFVDMEDCIVSSPSVGTLKRQSYAVSAGVGILHQSFTMKGCKFYADLKMIRSTDFTEKNWSLGFTLSTNSKNGNTTGASLAGSTITDCSFGGTLSTNETTVKNDSDATTFGTILNRTFTASDCEIYIASESYGKNEVTISGSSYWNGK